MKKRIPLLFLSCILLFFFALSACGDAAFLPGGKPKPALTGDNGTLLVHFLDVGQADSILLQSGTESMLIDGGNVADSSLVAAYLQEQGIEHLTYVVNTHAHEDHVGGLSGALNVCTADQIFAPIKEYNSKAFRDFSKYVSLQNKSITIPKPGDTFPLGGATVEVLAPQTKYSDENNSSIVLKVTHGQNSFLLTGDAERQSEQDMLAAGLDLSATFLKVGHHGSDSSTTYPFLREVMPKYAVISVGKDNTYGHPQDAVLSRLRDAGVTVYRTDYQGHIVATSDGKTLRFTTERNRSLPTNPTETDGSGQNGQVGIPSYYIGNRSSKKLHLPTCSSLPSEANQVRFQQKADALAQGYTPCSTCMK